MRGDRGGLEAEVPWSDTSQAVPWKGAPRVVRHLELEHRRAVLVDRNVLAERAEREAKFLRHRREDRGHLLLEFAHRRVRVDAVVDDSCGRLWERIYLVYLRSKSASQLCLSSVSRLPSRPPVYLQSVDELSVPLASSCLDAYVDNVDRSGRPNTGLAGASKADHVVRKLVEVPVRLARLDDGFFERLREFWRARKALIGLVEDVLAGQAGSDGVGLKLGDRASEEANTGVLSCERVTNQHGTGNPSKVHARGTLE